MKKIASFFLLLSLLLSLCACGAAPSETTAEAAETTEITEIIETTETAETTAAETTAEAATEKPTQDRAGNPISLPDAVNTVAVMAPSIAETLIAMGDADKIVAVDTQTQLNAYPELAADLPAFDMMTPDAEQLAALAPDIVLVSGVSVVEGVNPFQALIDLGIPMVCIPTSDSISGICDDITFLGAVMGRETEAEGLISQLNAQISEIKDIAATIPEAERKTVYFEIAAAPYAYSFGSGVYLNEMIELIGAENIFADQQSWMSVEIESVLSANPDVILTNVNYLDDPVGDICQREGWGGVTAIAEGQVYQIDNLSSSLANENIVKALKEMAKAVYPDYYKDI